MIEMFPWGKGSLTLKLQGVAASFRGAGAWRQSVSPRLRLFDLPEAGAANLARFRAGGRVFEDHDGDPSLQPAGQVAQLEDGRLVMVTDQVTVNFPGPVTRETAHQTIRDLELLAVEDRKVRSTHFRAKVRPGTRLFGLLGDKAGGIRIEPVLYEDLTPLLGAVRSREFLNLDWPWQDRAQHAGATEVLRAEASGQGGQSFDGRGIRIAVIDLAFCPAHPAFGSGGRTTRLVSFSQEDTRVTLPNFVHGNRVASIAAGAKNDGYRGAAPLSDLILAAIGSGSQFELDQDRLSDAIQYSLDPSDFAFGAGETRQDGADVIVSSLGSAATLKLNTSFRTELDRCASAGRRGGFGTPVFWPVVNDATARTSTHEVVTHENVMGISGCDAGAKELDAAKGPDLDLLAPGEAIFCADCLGYTRTPGPGTSLAAPCVAGIAALLLQKNPGLTFADLKTTLTRTASGGGNRDDRRGFGVVNALEAIEQV